MSWQVMHVDRGMGRRSFLITNEDGNHLPQTEDQAFLMAAAPELLESLNLAIQIIGHPDDAAVVAMRKLVSRVSGEGVAE